MSKREEGEETPSESDTSSDEEDSAAGSQSGSESEADSQTGSEESGESSEASEADSDGENSEMKGGSIGTSSEPSKARSAASDPKRPNQNLSGPTVAAAKPSAPEPEPEPAPAKVEPAPAKAEPAATTASPRRRIHMASLARARNRLLSSAGGARARINTANAAAAKAAAVPESKRTSEPAVPPQIAPVSQPAAPVAPAVLPPAVTAPIVARSPQATMPPQAGAPVNSVLWGLQAVPGTAAVANPALAGVPAAAGPGGGVNAYVGISRREEELEKENLELKAKVAELEMAKAKVAELEMAVKAAEAKRDEHERNSAHIGRTSQEEFLQLQKKNSKLEEENMILHNGAAELQMLKLEMAETENLHQATEQAIQRQLSVLTVEKMKLAHKVGSLEAENAEQRQQWLNYHKQWSRNTMHG